MCSGEIQAVSKGACGPRDACSTADAGSNGESQRRPLKLSRQALQKRGSSGGNVVPVSHRAKLCVPGRKSRVNQSMLLQQQQQQCLHCSGVGRLGLLGPVGFGCASKKCKACSGTGLAESDFIAIKSADISGDLVRLLCTGGLNGTDWLGDTSLCFAAQRGMKDAVEALLAAGADIRAKNVNGDDALMLASARGHKDVVLTLLGAGAADKCTGGENEDTALMWASRSGHIDVVRTLLDAGFATHAKGPFGITALMYAAQSGHEDVVKTILDTGATIDAQSQNGWTALMYAAHAGHGDTAAILLGAGADVNAVNSLGSTAMLLAAGNGHKSVVTKLLKKGAKIQPPKRQAVVQALFEAGLGAESSMRQGFDSNCASPVLVFRSTASRKLSDPDSSPRAMSPSSSSPVVVFRSGGSHDRRKRMASPSPVRSDSDLHDANSLRI